MNPPANKINLKIFLYLPDPSPIGKMVSQQYSNYFGIIGIIAKHR